MSERCIMGELMRVLEKYEGGDIHLELIEPLGLAMDIFNFKVAEIENYLMLYDKSEVSEPIIIYNNNIISFDEDMDITIIGNNLKLILSRN